MRRWMWAAVAVLAAGATAKGQKPPLLPEKDVAALANTLSGETAKRNLEGITRNHRQRGSEGFHAAAELIAERARAYGLSDVAILQFPADGKIFYGTQRSRPAWDAESAELFEVGGASSGRCVNATAEVDPKADEKTKKLAERLNQDCGTLVGDKLLASYEAEPIVLAEDSESADVTVALVDVGNGTKESDYAGKDVKGKIVLAAAQPGAVQDLAVGKFGAVGIVSYAQNQKTAWWGEDENLIRWGHLETFSPNKAFGFMVSLKTGRSLSERLAKGESITLRAVVKAGQHPGNYEIVTATIPGADPKLKDEEIAFSCHLDHQRPGANDNASGCVTILEVARTLQKLVANGTMARPARTIRFIWPPEIEGTLTLLNAKPEFRKRIKAVVHMDMVGGGPETKAVFHVTQGPMSLPSFVQDVAWAFAEFANQQSYKFAATGKADYPLVAPEGSKEPLRAEYSPYSMGSDHDVYQDSSFGIPSICLNDWPDRYIHTNFDSAANIDPTKLKRAAFIGAASGYYLARGSTKSQILQSWKAVKLGRSVRETQRASRSLNVDDRERTILDAGFCAYEMGFEIGVDEPSMKQLLAGGCPASSSATSPAPSKESLQKPDTGASGIQFQRKGEPKGPLAVFGYDYFREHAKSVGVLTPKLLSYEGLWGAGEEYAYEVLNFANGKRNLLEIRNAVSAEYGPVPLELVIEYLRALEKIGVVEQVH
jgi:aminopeptidase YwaD